MNAILTLLTVVALAAAAPTGIEAEVKAASKAFDQAQLDHDRAALESFLAADFVFVRGSGKVAGRDDFIATFANPAMKLEPFVITAPVFIPLGENAAIIGGEAVMRGVEDGKAFTEHFRFSDTFMRRGGKWQVVYTQVTMLPAL